MVGKTRIPKDDSQSIRCALDLLFEQFTNCGRARLAGLSCIPVADHLLAPRERRSLERGAYEPHYAPGAVPRPVHRKATPDLQRHLGLFFRHGPEMSERWGCL